MIYLLNTCGTSLKVNISRDANDENFFNNNNEINIARYLINKINRPSDILSNRILGAEINSIFSILKKYENEEFKFYFLVSDTKDGEKIGQVLKIFWENNDIKRMINDELNINIEDIFFEKIEKLIGDRENYKYFNIGLSNLVKKIAEIKQREQNANFIINATGGYKAQISFAGLIGQVLKMKIYYMFEGFEEVLELQPMPINFDYNLISQYYDILVDIDENYQNYDEIQNDFLYNNLIPDIFNLLDLVEIDGTRYFALSSVLTLALEGFKFNSLRDIKNIEDERKNFNPEIRYEDGNVNRVPGIENFFNRLARTGYFESLSTQRYIGRPINTRFEKGYQTNEIIIYFKSNDDFTARCIGVTIANNESERDFILNYLKTNF